MKFYQINEKLEECGPEELAAGGAPYAALVSREEFLFRKDLFNMGIDLDPLPKGPVETRIWVNYDSLTGSITIPQKKDPSLPLHHFSFALDERGIAFIEDDGTAELIMERIRQSKKWKMPSLERFLYDFLEEIVSDDVLWLEKYEDEMDRMEDRIQEGETEGILKRLSDIRWELLRMRTHYEHLLDLGKELEENENDFFAEENLRFFRLFAERVTRLQEIVNSLREHMMQVRDLYHSRLEAVQNRNMAYLTVIASIITPLTFITGWFGMNFKYMPELSKPWAYPAVIALCISIVAVNILIFKKKKWL